MEIIIYVFSVLILSGFILADGVRGDTPAESLTALGKEFREWRAKEAPYWTTHYGGNKYNDEVANRDWRTYTTKYNKSLDFLSRLQLIERSNLTLMADKVSYDIFKDILETYIKGYKWFEYSGLNPWEFLDGLPSYPGYFMSFTPVNTWGDIVNYLSRLLKIPNQMDQEKQNALKVIAGTGFTLHNVSVNRIPGQIDSMMVSNVTLSPLYTPFNEILDKMTSVPAADKADLKTRGAAAVQAILDKYGELKEFLIETYMPNTRSGYGLSTLGAKGKELYCDALKWHTSPSQTPKQVHEMGLSEVERISKSMTKLMQNVGHNGSITEFFQKVKTDENLKINSSEEILKLYEDRIKEATSKLPMLFKDYPGFPIKVQAATTDGPVGTYSAGSDDGSKPGLFIANVLRPREVPTTDIVAVALHEAVPGHHLQLGNYEKVIKIPKFRKETDYSLLAAPASFPGYTAYAEGWALYAEGLGVQMGLYKNDYEMIGRYAAELFRAARLVVDTGLHYYSWDRQKAIEYLLNYSSYSQNGVELEIDRYLTWPGQACAYKIGELKILELRKKAELELGSNYDVRDFHGVILNNGPLPLSVMENLVEEWIREVKEKNENNNQPSNSSTININILMFLSIILMLVYSMN